MSHFVFDGESSENFGFHIAEKNIYGAPERDMSFQSVPGRNGDVIMDNNCYKNITVSYTVGFMGQKEKAKSVKKWLCKTGYKVLYDSYQPLYFRLAAYDGKLDIEETTAKSAKAKLPFSCKPFMYSFAGQTAVSMTSAGNMENPEDFDSLPYIKIYANGTVTLTINAKAYLVNQIDGYIEIDSDLMAAYKLIHRPVYDDPYDISVPLPMQLTQNKFLNMQLEGYNRNGQVIMRSELIKGLQFLPSAQGEETGYDRSLSPALEHAFRGFEIVEPGENNAGVTEMNVYNLWPSLVINEGCRVRKINLFHITDTLIWSKMTER